MFKTGSKVAVINQTLGGRFIVEAKDAVVVRQEGDEDHYAVRIKGELVTRFLDKAAQSDPEAFVARLNALAGEAKRMTAPDYLDRVPHGC
jgi:hypothetical protein